MTTLSAGALRRRIVAAIVLGAAIAAGLVVHLALPDSAATDIAGDALYPVAVYALLVVVAPRAKPVVAGAATLVWCVVVELLQLTGIPQAAASVFPPAVLVLGTVFDSRDLVVYAVTALVATAVDYGIRSITSFVLRSPRPPTDEVVIRRRTG